LAGNCAVFWPTSAAKRLFNSSEVLKRKCLKEYSVVFLVEGEKFKLRNLLLEDFIFVVGSAAHSVGTTLEFAAFRSRLTRWWNTFSQENH